MTTQNLSHVMDERMKSRQDARKKKRVKGKSGGMKVRMDMELREGRTN